MNDSALAPTCGQHDHIKPCPHCRHMEASVIDGLFALGSVGKAVECAECFAGGPFRRDREQAIAAWNSAPRICQHCENLTMDLCPVINQCGNVSDWRCANCENIQGAELVDNETAELDRVKAQRDRAATLLNKVADQRYKAGRSALWYSGPIDMGAIRALLTELEAEK